MILERSEIVCSKISKAYDPKFAYESMTVSFIEKYSLFRIKCSLGEEHVCTCSIKNSEGIGC